MKTQSRLKDFKGLPHELSGLDYTTDSEVEGGEVSYTPRGAQHEFIFRKNSDNIKELRKQDKLRSKREEGDRISDISFDAIAKELMLSEAQQLASEGIDPFNEKEAFATGGTRLRYTSDGTLSQDASAPWRHMEEMSTGENVGWSILDAILPVQHFTGRSASEMWSGKTTQDPSSHGGEQTAGSTYGKFSSQYATPMAQGVLTGMGGSGMGGGGSAMGAIAGIGQASRRASQPGMDAAAADMGVRFHNADPTLKAGLESGGSAIGSTVGGFVGNTFTDPNGTMQMAPQEELLPTDPNYGLENIDPNMGYLGATAGSIPTIMRNGGMRKKYYANGGEKGDPFSSAYDEYMNYMSGDPLPEFPNMLPEAVVNSMYDYTTIPTDNISNSDLSGYTTASMDTTPANKKKVTKMPDLNAISATIGALGQAVPSLTYLGGEGKGYDKVRYPMYNPELLDGTIALRESRDAFGSSLEALRQRGQLDMGALSELATQGAKSSAGVRQNIANVNTGIKNDTQLKNIATLIKQFEDEAANKGASITNRQQALQNLTNVLAGTSRQTGMMSNDQMIKQRFTELFGEV